MFSIKNVCCQRINCEAFHRLRSEKCKMLCHINHDILVTMVTKAFRACAYIYIRQLGSFPGVYRSDCRHLPYSIQLFWVYVNFFHEQTHKNDTKICKINGRRLLVGAQRINTERTLYGTILSHTTSFTTRLCTYQFITSTSPPPGYLNFFIFSSQIPLPRVRKAVQMPHPWAIFLPCN